MNENSQIQTTKNPTNNIDVELTFYTDVEHGRTWVDKDKFPEFDTKYKQSQDDSSLSDTSNIEFEIHVKMLTTQADFSKTEVLKNMDTYDYCVWWSEWR